MKMLGGDESANYCRKSDICAGKSFDYVFATFLCSASHVDAFYVIATKNSRQFSGNFCVDEYLLRDHGMKDFSPYAIQEGHKLMLDGFVDESPLGSDVVSLFFGSEPLESGPSNNANSKKNETPVAEIFNNIQQMLNVHQDYKLSGKYTFEIGGMFGRYFIDTTPHTAVVCII